MVACAWLAVRPEAQQCATQACDTSAGVQNEEEDTLSATQFIQQTDPPKITVVVRKRPLNTKARRTDCTALARTGCAACE